jgi:hypothetical protein
VIAWLRRGADRRISVEARIRRKGGSWGSTLRVGPAQNPHPETLHATVSPTGRILIGWGAFQGTEGDPAPVEARVGIRNRTGGWVSRRLDRFTAENYPSAPRVLPRFDTAGRAYVSWVGPAGGGYEVKVAQIATTAVRPPAVISNAGDAVLEDAAAGPQANLAFAWSRMQRGERPSEVWVTRRTGPEGFEPPERLSTPTERPIAGLSQEKQGSVQLGFEPLTGMLTVVWITEDGDRRVVRAASRTG